MAVKTAEQTTERQVQFWSLLGPFVLLATLLVFFVKVSEEGIYIPLAALVGIPICWKWKMKGLVISLLFLGAMMFMSYGSIEPEEVMWHGGLVLAVALSFVVTSLSLEEASSLVQGIKNEIEKDKAGHSEAALENQHLKTSVLEARTELTRNRTEINRLESLVEMAREELKTANRQHEQLAQDLALKRNQAALLEEKLEEISVENTQMLGQVAAQTKEVQQSLRKVAAQEKLIEELNIQIAGVREQAAQARSALEDYEAVKLHLKDIENDMTILSAKFKASEDDLKVVQKERKVIEQALKQYDEPVDLIQETDLRKLRGLCRHYREQVQERSSSLNEARKELFHTQEKLLSLQKEAEEQQKYESTEAEKVIAQYVAQMEKETSESKQLLKQEISELQDLVSHLIS